MNEEKSFVLNVNENAARYLYRVAQWSTFFAVLGFIGAGLLVLASVSMLAFGSFLPFMKSMMPAEAGGFPAVIIIVLGVVYLAISVLYFIVSLKLYRFASKAKEALRSNDDLLLEESFKNLNTYLKITGIITIIFLSIYLIGIVVAVFAGVGSLLMQ